MEALDTAMQTDGILGVSEETSQLNLPAEPTADNSQPIGTPTVVAPASPVSAPATDGPTSGTSTNPPSQKDGGPTDGRDVETPGNDKLTIGNYPELLNQLRNSGLAPNGELPASATPPAAPVGEPTTPPAATPPVTAPTAPVVDTATATAAATEEAARLQQIKMRPQDEVEQSAMRLAKQTNKSVIDPEIINAARQLHGLPPINIGQAAPATTETTAPAPVVAPQTAADPNSEIQAAEAKLNALRAERRAAKENFDFEAEEAKELEIEAARDTLLELRQKANVVAQTQAVSVQDQFTKDWNDNLAIATKLFPAAAQPDSELARRAGELQEAARLSGDPIYHSAKSVINYYTAAAAELGITATPSAPVAPASVSTSQPSVRAPLSAIIAGGSSQSSTSSARPSTDQTPQINSVTDYENLIATAKGITYGSRRVGS